MRWRTLVGAMALLLITPAAWAIKEWYEFYHSAVEIAIPTGRYQQAAADLQEAMRLKPNSALNQQTYGLQFIDYLPQYYLGLCAFQLKDYSRALLAFDSEEKRGLIQHRPRLYADLKQRRREAQAEIANIEKQGVVKRVREELDRLLNEAAEAEAARRYETALTKLNQAQQAAQSIDSPRLGEIAERLARIRAAENSAERARRVEQLVAEGQRLLESGRETEATLKFDEALRIEAGQAAALEGKRIAQERIVATTTRQRREKLYQEGKDFFDAGKYDQAILPLTEAAADPTFTAARELLDKALKLAGSLRRQREIRVEIERLLLEGERLIEARRYSAAQVKFQDVLALDPSHVKAKERLLFAERRGQEMLFEQLMPNKPPVLMVVEPNVPSKDVDSQTVTVDGFALDDRGLARVDFMVNGKLVATQAAVARLNASEAPLPLSFNREFALDPGASELTIVATDIIGLTQSRSFRLTRRLRFWETKAFLPSAVLSAVALIGLGFTIHRLRQRKAVLKRFNPYIAGAPVMDASLFFGRQQMLTRILNVIHHNSLIVTGERRIGKTSLLFHLKKALENDDRPEYQFFPVFTDLQGVSEALFFHTLMTDILDTLQPSPATAQSLRYGHAEPLYDERDFSHDLRLVISEIKSRTAKRAKVVLLIDEVDALNAYTERTNQRLRSIFMKTFAEHLVAIMSGVGIRRTWKSEGSPWYNFFDEIALEPLTREEAQDLIRSPVSGIFRFEAEAVEAIIESSQLKPYIIQKLCVHAVNRMLEAGRTIITKDDVLTARETIQTEGKSPENPA